MRGVGSKAMTIFGWKSHQWPHYFNRYLNLHTGTVNMNGYKQNTFNYMAWCFMRIQIYSSDMIWPEITKNCTALGYRILPSWNLLCWVFCIFWVSFKPFSNVWQYSQCCQCGFKPDETHLHFILLLPCKENGLHISWILVLVKRGLIHSWIGKAVKVWHFVAGCNFHESMMLLWKQTSGT